MNTTNIQSWFPHFRLAWLERQAESKGYINRNDLIDTFNISSAQASSDLQKYQQLNPNSFSYNTSLKRYDWTGKAFVLSLPTFNFKS